MEYAIGVGVSLIVEGVKRYFGTNTFGTLLAVAVLSLAGAAFYTFFSETVWWQTMVQIILTASTFYAIILKQVMK